MKLAGLILFNLFIACFYLGCASGGRNIPGEFNPGEKVIADACLFDVIAHHNGKPTSIRLDLYITDTMMAFNGRGYLGKGAFKGWVKSDSVRVYFPTLGEYINDAYINMPFSNSELKNLANLNLLTLFNRLPDSVHLPGLEIRRDTAKTDKPVYDIYDSVNNWSLRISYRNSNNQNYLASYLEFDNQKGFSFKAKLRNVKLNVKIPEKHFQVKIPDDAIPMTN